MEFSSDVYNLKAQTVCKKFEKMPSKRQNKSANYP